MSHRSVTGALLALLCLLQVLCLWRSPAVFSPAAITVQLQRGQALTLGRTELGAPQAAARHLHMRRDFQGRWWVRNVSAGKQVVLMRRHEQHRMGGASLQGGQWFHIGATRFAVLAGDAQRTVFFGGGHTWQYDGALLLRDGRMLPACPGAGLAPRATALWNRVAPLAWSAARALIFGGNLHCGNRLGVPGLAGASAVMARTNGVLQLSHSGGSEAVAPFLLSNDSAEAGVDGMLGTELAQREEALDNVTALVAGRTRMALAVDEERLILRPIGHVVLLTEQRISLPPGVQWEWQRRAVWAIPAGTPWWIVCVLCLLLTLICALAWQRGRWPFDRATLVPTQLAAGGTALLAIAGLGALLLQRSGAGVGVGVSMLLAWSAMWSFLYVARLGTLASSAGILLLAAGLLAQLELGLGAMESSWLRHFHKTSALLAIGLGIGAHLTLRRRHQRALAPAPRVALEWQLAALAAASIGALALQVAFGSETGVFNLQPVEFAKLALTALTAHCMAIGLGWHRDMPQPSSATVRWLRVAAPALLFIALLGMALLQVDDYSPLILLLVWSMGMTLAAALAVRRLALAGMLALTGSLAIAAIVWLRMAGADDSPPAGFYGDRFAVWLDPARHPHTGQQMLLAARAIADGAWWGASNWLGIGALGQAAGTALTIPAVQDDFAPAFFIHRHGLIGALALWTLQVLFVAGLLQTAVRALHASLSARHFQQAWIWRFRCFVLCGGAAFVVGHLLLSWGTNLAIFPIMGQPMSFLSAGGSHLLFFICPLLAFHAVSAQLIKEKAPCQSMSNTKFWAKLATYSMPKASGRRRGWRCSRAARCCATCWNALRANVAGGKRRAAFRM